MLSDREGSEGRGPADLWPKAEPNGRRRPDADADVAEMQTRPCPTSSAQGTSRPPAAHCTAPLPAGARVAQQSLKAQGVDARNPVHPAVPQPERRVGWDSCPGPAWTWCIRNQTS